MNDDGPQGTPRAVLDALRFYERAVTDRDNGSVGLFAWELDGSPLYLVRCTTDGSDGFLEVYDRDGSALGFARTYESCPVWTSRGVVRRRAFVGDHDEVDDQLADAAKRFAGAGP
ncbi:hypothetical protein OJF2_75620 [Aquisphaera giovannonii]|uniref:Uncharacterized protein n=1 Tax=Aquisphaera giovannonii TaxID=406548 RepID=A0A5B9WEE6_9BACT|nr:hypothetical protein [Aquisphaera giovannonii]QEH38952.1 hypothetical protein OJF2_75620 [Aquisphaera giovannonii]